MTQHEIASVEVESEERIGVGGFLVLRRLILTNQRADGSRSAAYKCDFVERPYGLDAVAIVVFRDSDGDCDGGAEVLLRRGLRPPMAFGRDVDLPIAEEDHSPFCIEIAAGLIEKADRGEDGIRGRALAELDEELGLTVDAAALTSLGASVVPTPSVIPERLYLYAAKVSRDVALGVASGDGSPMEEGATATWWGLEDAIAACISGEISDAKTEIGLRRLRDQLAG